MFQLNRSTGVILRFHSGAVSLLKDGGFWRIFVVKMGNPSEKFPG